MKLSAKLLIIPAIALVLAGCSKQTTTETPAATDSVPAAESQELVLPADGEVVVEEPTEGTAMMESTPGVINMEMSPFKFSQTEIKAKAGDTIKIKLVNNEGMHDLVIDELDVKSKQLKAGESEELTIVIPLSAKGKTFEYYCSVGNHRQQGMVGKLIIE